MNYQDYVNELSVLLPQPLVSPFVQAAPFVDPNYNLILPRCIEYAENMIYRDPDINFLHGRVSPVAMLSAGNRIVTLPSNVVILEQLSVFTPAFIGTARTAFLPASVDYINLMWPDSTITQSPATIGSSQPVFAMMDDATCMIAPTPDAAYMAEFIGVGSPTPLPQTATGTSYLTVNYPDLFIAASMIYMSGVMKDYGSQADDPQLAQSWSTQYGTLKRGVVDREARRRQAGASWTAYPPTTEATPPRG